MFNIFTDVRLKQDGFAIPGNSTTIDEILRDVTHFGHVRVRRYGIAIRQNKTWESIRIFCEDGTEIKKFHVLSIFLSRNIVKPRTRDSMEWARHI